MIIKNLTKTYKLKNSPPVKALDGIDIELPDSGLIFVLGKSGCGKTTFLNIIGGLDRADSGSVIFGGKDLCTATERELRSYRNSCCGFVFQEYNLISELNLSENITLALDIKHEKDDGKLKEILEEVDLLGLETRRINELSGGQKQRVAIARSLIKNPKIILADEPTGALDSATGENILNILKKISRDRLVIVVSHDREAAKKYADRIIELSDGKVIRDTDENYRHTDSGEFSACKADIPLKTAFKIGVNSIKLHPIKFFMMILISVLSFSFLGTSLAGAFVGSADILLSELKTTQSVAIYKCDVVQNDGMTVDELLGANYKTYTPVPLTYEEIANLNGKSHLPVIGSVNVLNSSLQHAYATQPVGVEFPKDRHYAIVSFGFLCATQDELSALGYTLTGRLPQNAEEIAVPECIFNSFKFLGLNENGTDCEINGKEDILGKKIPVQINSGLNGDEKTVVGIVGGCCYKDVGIDYKKAYDSKFQYELCEKFFVSSDFFDEYSCAVTPVGEDTKNLVKHVLNSDNGGKTCLRLQNSATDNFYRSESFLNMMRNLFTYLGIIFVALSVLLLLNFVATSIQSQIKQIGILSTLGVGTGGIFKIYLSVMSIFGVITFCMSYGLSFLWNRIVNSVMTYNGMMNMFLFNFPAMLCLFAIIVATVAVGTVIPVLLIKRKTPAEIIRKGSLQ